MAVVKKSPAAAAVATASKNQAKQTKTADLAPYLVKITGQPEKAYRAGCMRDKWWVRFNSFNGKPLKDLETSCMKDPPSLPKKAEGDAAKMEKFSGWLAFFKDEQGHLALIQGKTK